MQKNRLKNYVNSWSKSDAGKTFKVIVSAPKKKKFYARIRIFSQVLSNVMDFSNWNWVWAPFYVIGFDFYWKP